MAITVVGTAAEAVPNGDPVVFLLPEGVQAGDCLVAVGGHPDVTFPVQVAGIDSEGGSAPFTEVLNETNGSEPGAHLVAAYRFFEEGDQPAVACASALNSNYSSAYALVILRGVDTTTPLDAAAQFSTGSSDPDSPSITTVTDGAVVVSGFFKKSLLSGSFAGPSGYGDVDGAGADDTVDASAGIASKTVASAGAENPGAFTNGGAGEVIAVTMAFRPASAPSLEESANPARESDSALPVGIRRSKSIGAAVDAASASQIGALGVITVVGTASKAAINGNNVTLNLPAGMQEGDLVVALGGHASIEGDVSVSDGTNAYTEIVDATNGPSPGAHLFVGYKFMGPTPDTQAFGLGSGAALNATAYVAIVLRGVDPNSPLDAAVVVDTDDTDQPNCPAITTNTDGALVLACFQKRNQSSSIVAPAGYSHATVAAQNDTNDANAGLAVKIVSTAGVEDPGDFAGQGADNEMVLATIAFRPISDDGSVSLSPSNETDSAVAISFRKSKEIEAALASDVAISIGHSRGAVISSAESVSNAVSVSHRKSLTVGPASETALGLLIEPRQGILVSVLPGIEAASAQPLSSLKTVALSAARDISFAVRIKLPQLPPLSVVSDQLISPYTPKPLPVIRKPFDPVTKYLLEENKRMQATINQLVQASPIVANKEPERPRRGMLRYAVAPWNPLGTGFSGLVIYDGNTWNEA